MHLSCSPRTQSWFILYLLPLCLACLVLFIVAVGFNCVHFFKAYHFNLRVVLPTLGIDFFVIVLSLSLSLQLSLLQLSQQSHTADLGEIIK